MRKIALIFAFLFLAQGMVFAWNPFKKKYDKQQQEKQPMVQTVDEWMESATSVKMDMRKREEDKSQKDENVIPPAERPVYLTPYNIKAGSRELDLTGLSKNKNARSLFVADPKFNNAIYSEIYFYPQTKQTASTIYLIELDSNLSKKERLSDASIFEHTRYPLISTALPYLKDEFFSTLTPVDFSSNGKKFLVKEKRGSRRYGIYETYVWIYFLSKENRENNECYRNNINFSNELSALDYLSDDVQSSQNILNLKNAPEIDANLGQQEKKEDIRNNLSHIEGLNQQISDIQSNSGANIAFEKLKPEDVNYDVLKDNPVQYFDYTTSIKYEDLNGFILGSWKNQSESSESAVTTSRWFNPAPSNFTLDDTYSNSKNNIGYGVRLNLLNETIKAYWFDKKNMILNHIRWDLRPLGFSQANNDEIIVDAFCWDKNGHEISLGRWAVNINDGLPRLTLPDEKIEIQANGFIAIPRINQ